MILGEVFNKLIYVRFVSQLSLQHNFSVYYSRYSEYAGLWVSTLRVCSIYGKQDSNEVAILFFTSISSCISSNFLVKYFSRKSCCALVLSIISWVYLLVSLRCWWLPERRETFCVNILGGCESLFSSWSLWLSGNVFWAESITPYWQHY